MEVVLKAQSTQRQNSEVKKALEVNLMIGWKTAVRADLKILLGEICIGHLRDLR